MGAGEAVRVFISFSTSDLKRAAALYEEMAGAGAEVFQFGRSETAGKPSSEEILAWIKSSDVFIVLVSRSALESGPVQGEIRYAHYCHTNTSGKKPGRLIPGLIRAGVDPPILIEHFSRLDLRSSRGGVTRLLSRPR